MKRIEEAIRSEWMIFLYRNVVEDYLVQMYLDLLKEVVKNDTEPSRLIKQYNRFTAALVSKSGGGLHCWENYLLDLIMKDENPFSRQAAIHEANDIPTALKKAAEQDLHNLQAIALVPAGLIRETVSKKAGLGQEEFLPDWQATYFRQLNDKKSKEEIKSLFHALPRWEEGLEGISRYYRKNGVGIFGEYHAFRWVHTNGNGELAGVSRLDALRLDQLYEYEREHARIIQNTEQFLKGYPANNVLLYGDRGTGKSSTVKALVKRYGDRGLRLIEIRKQDLADFPLVISMLAERPQRFILFVDDLSFSEQEGQYRELKALLEGGLESRPENVLVYATSNRRHLVQEKHADKEAVNFDPEMDDVRHLDTLQEKLSLADRFGITVTFSAPDQRRYLAIVEKLAEERGLKIEKEELHQRAIKWEMSFNARSARTARQFVDYLEGQLALEKEAN